MSNLVCLAGLSNSGKSTSLRTLDPESTFIISCTNKQLQIPGFRKKYPKVAIKDKSLLAIGMFKIITLRLRIYYI